MSVIVGNNITIKSTIKPPNLARFFGSVLEAKKPTNVGIPNPKNAPTIAASKVKLTKPAKLIKKKSDEIANPANNQYLMNVLLFWKRSIRATPIKTEIENAIKFIEVMKSDDSPAITCRNLYVLRYQTKAFATKNVLIAALVNDCDLLAYLPSAISDRTNWSAL